MTEDKKEAFVTRMAEGRARANHLLAFKRAVALRNMKWPNERDKDEAAIRARKAFAPSRWSRLSVVAFI